MADPQAKTRLSELLDEATTKGPQIITRHGVERAVILSIAEYRALSSHKPDLRAILLGGPKDDEFLTTRDEDFGRTINL